MYDIVLLIVFQLVRIILQTTFYIQLFGVSKHHRRNAEATD